MIYINMYISTQLKTDLHLVLSKLVILIIARRYAEINWNRFIRYFLRFFFLITKTCKHDFEELFKYELVKLFSTGRAMTKDEILTISISQWEQHVPFWLVSQAQEEAIALKAPAPKSSGHKVLKNNQSSSNSKPGILGRGRAGLSSIWRYTQSWVRRGYAWWFFFYPLKAKNTAHRKMRAERCSWSTCVSILISY